MPDKQLNLLFFVGRQNLMKTAYILPLGNLPVLIIATEALLLCFTVLGHVLERV